MIEKVMGSSWNSIRRRMIRAIIKMGKADRFNRIL